MPQQATFAPSRRPARSPALGFARAGGTPTAAPAESPSTTSTRASGRHAESTHRTPLLNGQTLPAGALGEPRVDRAARRIFTALASAFHDGPLGFLAGRFGAIGVGEAQLGVGGGRPLRTISRMPVGRPLRQSPSISATQAPSRISPSSSTAGVHAPAGTFRTAAPLRFRRRHPGVRGLAREARTVAVVLGWPDHHRRHHGRRPRCGQAGRTRYASSPESATFSATSRTLDRSHRPRSAETPRIFDQALDARTREARR